MQCNPKAIGNICEVKVNVTKQIEQRQCHQVICEVKVLINTEFLNSRVDDVARHKVFVAQRAIIVTHQRFQNEHRSKLMRWQTDTVCIEQNLYMVVQVLSAMLIVYSLSEPEEDSAARPEWIETQHAVRGTSEEWIVRYLVNRCFGLGQNGRVNCVVFCFAHLRRICVCVWLGAKLSELCGM